MAFLCLEGLLVSWVVVVHLVVTAALAVRLAGWDIPEVVDYSRTPPVGLACVAVVTVLVCALWPLAIPAVALAVALGFDDDSF